MSFLVSVLGPANAMRVASAISTAKSTIVRVAGEMWDCTVSSTLTVWRITTTPCRVGYAYAVRPCYLLLCAPGGAVYTAKQIACRCHDRLRSSTHGGEQYAVVGRAPSERTPLLDA